MFRISCNIFHDIYTVWQESFKTDFCVAKHMVPPAIYHWKKVVGYLTNEEKNTSSVGAVTVKL